MKTRVPMTMCAVVALPVVVALLSLPVLAQDEPPKKKPAEKTQPLPTIPEPPAGQTGAPGMADTGITPYPDVRTQIDLAVERMTASMLEAQVLSKSFEELAALHQGADRSEILMMKRMSDSMGTMAGELKTSFQQYKKMLDEETASESGAMKVEVQSLKLIIDGMARQVDAGLDALRTLQGQLGQG